MYYGWNIVIYSGLIYSVILGSTYSAFGLFIVPVSADLHLSRADMNMGVIVLNAGAALLAPLAGWVLDRVPTRRVMIVSALLAGMSFASLSFSRSTWLSLIVLALPLAIAIQGAGILTCSVLLARWFTVRRARAMLLAFTGASLGGIFLVPAIGWLLGREGWRTTLLIMGIAITALVLLMALLIRERPRPGELEGATEREASRPETATATLPKAPKTILSLLAMPQFWTIGVGCGLGMAIVQADLLTIVPLAMDGGLSALQAAGLISLTSAAAVVTKLSLAIVADRLDRIVLMTGLIAIAIVVNLLLLIGSAYWVLVACSLLIGLGSSALSPILQAILADRFGASSFGTVRGLMMPLSAILGMVAIRIAGDVFDRFHGYHYLFVGFAVAGVLAAALMLATRWTSVVQED